MRVLSPAESTALAQSATITLNATGSPAHTFFSGTPQAATVQIGAWFSPVLPTSVTLDLGVPKNVFTRLLSLTAIGTCANVPAESQSLEHTVVINGTTLNLPLQVTQQWLSATCAVDPQLRIHACGSGCGPQNLLGTPASGSVNIGGGYTVKVTILSTVGDFRQAGQGAILTTQLLLTETDSDGDGVPDNQDACPGGDDNLDADADGTADFCDVCAFDPDNDVDGDGVCGDEDNCPDVPNPTQLDADADGLGDACDCVVVNQCVTIRRGTQGNVADTRGPARGGLPACGLRLPERQSHRPRRDVGESPCHQLRSPDPRHPACVALDLEQRGLAGEPSQAGRVLQHLPVTERAHSVSMGPREAPKPRPPASAPRQTATLPHSQIT